MSDIKNLGGYLGNPNLKKPGQAIAWTAEQTALS